MGSRHPNPRRAKIHRSYSVEEMARLFDIHKNTIRTWLKQGLEAIDGQRRPWSVARKLVVSLQTVGRERSRPAVPAEFTACRAAPRRCPPGRWRNAWRALT